jgi:hypothetical protein
MDYEAYKEKYFVRPQPESGFGYQGVNGATLFFQDYESAIAYYTNVLGPPAYKEGEYTHGWRLGGDWLTLFPSKSGNPTNMEITIRMETPQEAERLQQAFIDAGGEGEPPSDQLMYDPIRYCFVTDPFGTRILITSLLPIE